MVRIVWAGTTVGGGEEAAASLKELLES